jgi:PIN domain nuclease of toxin-antitoxin system
LTVASIWEIGIKVAIGKLPLPEPIDSYILTRMMLLDMRYLEITAPHALRAAALPLHHKADCSVGKLESIEVSLV